MSVETYTCSLKKSYGNGDRSGQCCYGLQCAQPCVLSAGVASRGVRVRAGINKKCLWLGICGRECGFPGIGVRKPSDSEKECTDRTPGIRTAASVANLIG